MRDAKIKRTFIVGYISGKKREQLNTFKRQKLTFDESDQLNFY
jgi:hypothetical protein